MSEHLDADQPIRSSLAADPEMVDLVELFVRELPQRVAALEAAASAGDGLRRLAHQLKGAGSGYGFAELSAAAAALERIAVDDTATVVEVHARGGELVDICRRVTI